MKYIYKTENNFITSDGVECPNDAVLQEQINIMVENYFVSEEKIRNRNDWPGYFRNSITGKYYYKVVDGSVALQDTSDIEKLRSFYKNKLSKESFKLRSLILPDYKLTNAALGIYTTEEIANIKATIEAFRAEYYRVAAIMDTKTTENDLKICLSQEPSFPESLISI